LSFSRIYTFELLILCVQQQERVAIIEPDAGDPDNIDTIIKNAKKKAPLSFTKLYEAIQHGTADSFISKLQVNLRQMRSMTLKRKEEFPVEVVLHVLSLYRQLITVYLDTEALRQEELSIQSSKMVESCDRHSPLERFKSFFTTFSTPIPTGFQEVFGENVQLAIDCWAALTWQERQKLRSGFLVRDIFKSLDTIRLDACPRLLPLRHSRRTFPDGCSKVSWCHHKVLQFPSWIQQRFLGGPCSKCAGQVLAGVGTPDFLR
jgi:hypothetical protein